MAPKAKKAKIYDRAAHEWYVDTPSVSDALFRVESFSGVIYDPCAGMGNILRSANFHGYAVRGSDLRPRPEHYKTLLHTLEKKPVDFITSKSIDLSECSVVMNPPYGKDDGADARIEEQFICRALDLARYKVAAVVQLRWIVPRIELLRQMGCIRIWVVSPRPSMLPGENIVRGEMPGGGQVDYAWVVFIRGADIAPTIGVAKRNPEFDKASEWQWRLSSGG